MNIGAVMMPSYSHLAADIQSLPPNSLYYSPYVYSYLNPHSLALLPDPSTPIFGFQPPTIQNHLHSIQQQQILAFQQQHQIHQQQQLQQLSRPISPFQPDNAVNTQLLLNGNSYQLQFTPQLPLQNPQHLMVPNNQYPRREWTNTFDGLLLMAHQKYNTHDYNSALSILQDLYSLNRTHLPTLLLLGCTCYSLNLYQLSIIYNNLILSLDSNFAEAYSNLGTTYRAFAHAESNPSAAPQPSTISKIQQQEILQRLKAQTTLPDVVLSLHPTLYAPTSSGDAPTSIDLAERFYKIAISIRPKYWDATINLAGLLTSQSRYHEALEVYTSLEQLFNVSYPTPLPASDIDFVKLAIYVEQADQSNATKRRDLVYSKANLMYALGDVQNAKREYLKSLVVAKIDVLRIYAGISVEYPSIDGDETVSGMLVTVAKMYQDEGNPVALMFYFAAVTVKATPNACNNLGIMLAQTNVDQAVKWYRVGLALDAHHVHLYTNLGSALKDQGNVAGAVDCYQKAIGLQPNFWIALANLANLYKDLGRVEEAIGLYRRALNAKPEFIEAFCNLVNSLLFVCDWEKRDENLVRVQEIVRAQLSKGKIPTVLPFHTFTYSSLSAMMVREISRRNAERVTQIVEGSPWFPGFPKRALRVFHESLVDTKKDRVEINQNMLLRSLQYPYPYQPPPIGPKIRLGYVSSDFVNHPLAHLMQSVFGFHNRSKFTVFCYSLSTSDNSPFRQKIESEADVFIQVHNWSVQQIVERILVDKIHVLVNLNGYTKGARNEIFAARPAPIQMAFMGFAGTMGAGEVYDPGQCGGEAQSLRRRWSEDDGFDEWLKDSVRSSGGIVGSRVAEFDGLRSRWIDFMVVDEIACPRKLVCGEPLTPEIEAEDEETEVRGKVSVEDDRNRIYTERLMFMPHSFFVNDHRQGFREEEDPVIDSIVLNAAGLDTFEHSAIGSAVVSGENSDAEKMFSEMMLEDDDGENDLTESERNRWRKEEIKRLKMRQEVFPWLREDTVIYANFNQLYKIDPEIFKTWMKIIKRVPNSILWLLRFPPAGEHHLKKKAIELVGEEVASRLVFTDVAPKHIHIHRGRIADVFLDTPECNAHTTAADILWSGTPILTYPKYDFKMCSRVAASIAYATGNWSEKQMRRFKFLRGEVCRDDKVDSSGGGAGGGNGGTVVLSGVVSTNQVPLSPHLKVNSGIQKSTKRTQKKIRRQITTVRREDDVDDGFELDEPEDGYQRRRKYGLEKSEYGEYLEKSSSSGSNEVSSGESEPVKKEADEKVENVEEWEPRGLNLKLDRLKDRSLLGHHMVVNSYDEYEEHAVKFGLSMKWQWKEIGSWNEGYRGRKKSSEKPLPVLPDVDTLSLTSNLTNTTAVAFNGVEGLNPQLFSFNQLPELFTNTPIVAQPSYPPTFFPRDGTKPTHIFAPQGLLIKLRRRLFITRDEIPIFDTYKWVCKLEKGMERAYQEWSLKWMRQKQMNEAEFRAVQVAGSVESLRQSFLERVKERKSGEEVRRNDNVNTRCVWIE
ncbi:hypothetical protein HK098_002071 [Nowakowskiella sp. JEL0407]|nr:hypothetical protein HK098_002071 [Nowakowskiella sp. JEL0407]